MMRILQIVQKPQLRGAEVFAFQLSADMRQLGHTVATAYLYPYPGETLLPLLSGDYELAGNERHWLERAPGVHPGLLTRLAKVIQKFQPDIVQVNGARTVKYGAFSKRWLRGDWKLVYRNIDNPTYWVTDQWRRWFYKRLVMPQLDGIVGVSQFTLESVRRMYGAETPAVYIPNGIDIKRLTGLPEPPQARRQLGVASNNPIVLFMGNLTRQKRPDRFVRVVGMLHKQYPDLRAWILGSGPLQGSVEAQVRAAGLQDIVTFWGYQEQVGLYLAAADLLLVTSDSDGIPAVILEAGALGMPVVATQVGGIPECVLDDETGLLVEPQDETGLAKAVLRLLNDEPLRARLSEQVRAWVPEQFAMERVANAYLKFYHHLASSSVTHAYRSEMEEAM